MSSPDELPGELRPASFAIAYRMLGSVAEAEDVVQEAMLRVHRALEDGERLESPRAFVATVTTRLAILERLSPEQRAVLLLRDVFDYRYDEFAGIVGLAQAGDTDSGSVDPARRSQRSTRSSAP